jgi:large subunit ribosomal protein L30
MAEIKKIKITQIKSIIEQIEGAKRNIKALGLGRPNYFVVKNDTPQIRGMINKVRHLVKVEEVQ